MATYYDRKPSIAAAAVFAAAFGLVTIATLIQVILVARKGKDKRVLILIPFILGGICETLGYIARICSIKSPDLLGPWIAQNLLILVAPALFTMTFHLTINRVFSVLDARKYSIIPLKWLAKVFVIGDLLCFFLQGAGSGLLSRPSESQHELGSRIIVGGSALQMAVFVLFIVVIAIFKHRLKKDPTTQSMEYRFVPSKTRNWRMILATLYMSSVFVIVRSLVLCVEYGMGADSHLAKIEGYMYVFDAALMFLSMLLFTYQNLGGYFYYMRYEARKSEEVALEQVENDLKLVAKSV